MGALYILIPIALLFLAGAVWAFFWAVDHDQFEDLDREAQRILLDDVESRERGKAPSEGPT